MRTVTRFRASVLVLLALGALGAAWWLRSAKASAPTAIRPGVLVSAATPDQLELAKWAVRRFEAADLHPPSVEIEFHRDPSGCAGHLGFATNGHVDLCSTLVNSMARRALLHEFGHIWLDQNLDADVRARFLQVRALRSWNASSDPWELRGYEQGAEIISWALGERILSAQIPDNEPSALEAAFEVLTGNAPPAQRSGSRCVLVLPLQHRLEEHAITARDGGQINGRPQSPCFPQVGL
jgi:hypothetical protein